MIICQKYKLLPKNQQQGLLQNDGFIGNFNKIYAEIKLYAVYYHKYLTLNKKPTAKSVGC